MIGSELAGYRIESLLGRGGMSVVYLAEQVRLGRKVALKLLSPELAEDPNFRDRFEHESRLAASLDHPHVTPIYEAGEADGMLFIAMKHVPGSTLEDVIRAGGPLEPQRAVAIMAQVAEALDAAHEEGLVHRDVKPSNVLLAQARGGRDHAYLADFGLTKRRSSIAAKTKTGQFIGSIDYASPEQIEGKPLDGRSDQYSLACVLYFCLTGRRPFERHSEVAVLYAHLKDRPPSASALKPEVPSELDRAVVRAMSKSPGDRYQLCSELTGASVPSVAAPAPSRRRALLAVAAAAAAVVLASAGALIWATAGGDEPRPSAPPVSGTTGQRGILRIDLSTRQPVAAVSLTGITWMDSTEDLVWALVPPRKLTKVRPETNSVIAQIELPPFVPPYGTLGGQAPDLVAEDGAIWVIGRNLKRKIDQTADIFEAQRVIRIDPTTNTARSRVIRGAEGAAGLAYGKSALWSHDQDSEQLLRFDPRTLKLVTRISVLGTTQGPSSLAYGEGFVWIVDATSEIVTKVDPSTNTVAATIEVDGAQEVTTGEGAAWVTTDRGTVAALSPAVDAVLAEVEIGPPPRVVSYETSTYCCHPGAGILVADGSVWAVSTGDDKLVEIDPVTYEVESRIPIARSPQDITAAAGSLWVSVR